MMLFEEKASSLDPRCTTDQVRAWIESMRTTVGKITRRTSESCHDARPMTDREWEVGHGFVWIPRGPHPQSHCTKARWSSKLILFLLLSFIILFFDVTRCVRQSCTLVVFSTRVDYCIGLSYIRILSYRNIQSRPKLQYFMHPLTVHRCVARILHGDTEAARVHFFS